MANNSSSKKSIRKIKARTAVNKNRLSRIKTYIKKVHEAISAHSSSEDILSTFTKAQSEIARGAQKGLLKANNASRKISRLAAKISKL
ncbi:MAG: 30S ribosomal protein S20 [Rickettsiaceae bacterium]|nr:30S ribosomal protein S20 [Rickettsiaceae bacterium]